MLQSTFRHLKGVGAEVERRLWQEGVRTWEDFQYQDGGQLRLFGDSSTVLSESQCAFESRDADFFAGLLKPADYYRIALAFPSETLFLDIETTGLSLYYDELTMVGWSCGSEYRAYIAGQDPRHLLSELGRAKVLVTFNGTMFDMKFLQLAFPELRAPSAHLDLRYFARRAGFPGGQKVVESRIGFQRDDDLLDMKGESAPVLWHRYRRGDTKALENLIRYNHADVEGMKYILDKAIQKIFDIENVPTELRPSVKFSSSRSSIRWAKSCRNGMSNRGIVVEKPKDRVGPRITFSQLDRIHSLSNFTVVGLDIVSSESKETGCCALHGNQAKTVRLKSDDELIDFVLHNGADLVSIDSPLSIPAGRTSFFDDDPMRDQFGIMRECERTLKKRGVNVYPCLIPSMQKLTQRGVRLADKLRKLGVATIESYPGAAQDIMGIPRKRAGIEYLAEGLADFGLEGSFRNEKVSHDELDAITSAAVGLFFWAGKFEALGNEDEDYLIIPDLRVDPHTWTNRFAIGISGEISAGKTTVANFLSNHGFVTTRYSGVLESMLLEKGESVNRINLQSLGWDVHQNLGQRWLGARALESVNSNSFIAIDGMRFLEDRAFLEERFGPAFLHLHVESELGVRSRRTGTDGSRQLQSAATRPTESEVHALGQKADVIVENNSTLDVLYQQLKSILGRTTCQ